MSSRRHRAAGTSPSLGLYPTQPLSGVDEAPPRWQGHFSASHRWVQTLVSCRGPLRNTPRPSGHPHGPLKWTRTMTPRGESTGFGKRTGSNSCSAAYELGDQSGPL